MFPSAESIILRFAWPQMPLSVRRWHLEANISSISAHVEKTIRCSVLLWKELQSCCRLPEQGDSGPACPAHQTESTHANSSDPKVICKFNPTLNYFSGSRAESFWEENTHENQYSGWGLHFQKRPAIWSLHFKKFFMDAWYKKSQAHCTGSGKLHYLLPSPQWKSALSTVLKEYYCYYYLDRIYQQSKKIWYRD